MLWNCLIEYIRYICDKCKKFEFHNNTYFWKLYISSEETNAAMNNFTISIDIDIDNIEKVLQSCFFCKSNFENKFENNFLFWMQILLYQYILKIIEPQRWVLGFFSIKLHQKTCWYDYISFVMLKWLCQMFTF